MTRSLLAPTAPASEPDGGGYDANAAIFDKRSRLTARARWPGSSAGRVLWLLLRPLDRVQFILPRFPRVSEIRASQGGGHSSPRRAIEGARSIPCASQRIRQTRHWSRVEQIRPRPPFRLPDALVAVHTSRLACRSRKSGSIRESSGESQV